jgi:hypothetical protein
MGGSSVLLALEGRPSRSRHPTLTEISTEHCRIPTRRVWTSDHGDDRAEQRHGLTETAPNCRYACLRRRDGASNLRWVTEPQELVGTFVVEIGERQAWPFMTFCDNDAIPSREARLYIDTGFTLNGALAWSSGHEPAVVELLPLNSLEVVAVDVNGAELSLTFSDDTRMVVSGVAAEWTTHDVWWLGPWTQ